MVAFVNRVRTHERPLLTCGAHVVCVDVRAGNVGDGNAQKADPSTVGSSPTSARTCGMTWVP
jgi:hypothetical protein